MSEATEIVQTPEPTLREILNAIIVLQASLSSVKTELAFVQSGDTFTRRQLESVTDLIASLHIKVDGLAKT